MRKAAGEENLPARLTARDALPLPTIEGTKANGLEAETARLTGARQAVLILLRQDKINVMPVNELVDSVYVDGRARKQAGQLVGADPARVAEQAITSRVCLASKVANGCLRASARRASLGGGRWRCR